MQIFGRLGVSMTVIVIAVGVACSGDEPSSSTGGSTTPTSAPATTGDSTALGTQENSATTGNHITFTAPAAWEGNAITGGGGGYSLELSGDFYVHAASVDVASAEPGHALVNLDVDGSLSIRSTSGRDTTLPTLNPNIRFWYRSLPGVCDVDAELTFENAGTVYCGGFGVQMDGSTAGLDVQASNPLTLSIERFDTETLAQFVQFPEEAAADAAEIVSTIPPDLISVRMAGIEIACNSKVVGDTDQGYAAPCTQ